MSRKQGFYPHLTSSSSQQSLLLVLALTLSMVSEELASTDDSQWKFAYSHSNGPRLWVASGLITGFLNKHGGFQIELSHKKFPKKYFRGRVVTNTGDSKPFLLLRKVNYHVKILVV